VTAFDGSEAMVAAATKEAGQQILQLKFQDMDYRNSFDGVWACASLLHVPYDEVPDIFLKIHAALKPNGIFHASYKYGNQHMNQDGRDFYNMDEVTIKPYLSKNFKIIEIWDRPANSLKVPSPVNKWLHVISKKLA